MLQQSIINSVYLFVDDVASLEKHLTAGNHNFTNRSPIAANEPKNLSNNTTILNVFRRGWVLPNSKITRFSYKQELYLFTIYTIYNNFMKGEKSDVKSSPENIVKEMRQQIDPTGRKWFQPFKYMSSSQNRSLFSRMSDLHKGGTLKAPSSGLEHVGFINKDLNDITEQEKEEHLLPPPYQTNCRDNGPSDDGENFTNPNSYQVCLEICKSEYSKEMFGCDHGMTMQLSTNHLCYGARLQLNCSENVDKEAAGKWINEDSTLECYEVLSDDDIKSRVTCGSEETRNLEECDESDEENLVTNQKLSHGDALVHTKALRNYLEQETESTNAEKLY
ncbi:hypothetical protein AVEN_160094-1 [Araneus ventricosus]|uniref:Uncharacterized protein n=1 Tax=Araneus ventricosus TaxID=182803 RepID=A0A4Y2GI17_ARAVE|nr:hypothetical protein AVEN_160094-1 [Araneus ventricosus]